MKTSSDKISIVLPTYNGAKYIKKSIESCLNQTHTNVELIIINDGSSDETDQIVGSFKDDRIKYTKLENNKGFINALNTGFAQTQGDYLTWTSDDNYYELNAFEVMFNFLKTNQQIDFVYANYNVIDENGNFIRQGKVKPPKELDNDNYVGSCFLYRRRVYERVGSFNPDVFLAEDYEYWLRVREKYKMKKIEETLYSHRLHTKSLTISKGEEKVQAQVEKVRERFIPKWKSLFFAGRKAYYQEEYSYSKQLLLKSILRNPFYYESLRLILINIFKR